MFKQSKAAVYLDRRFDFETCASYFLHTIDFASRKLLQKIRIKVLDVDEFFPRIANGPNLTFQVLNSATVGDTIGRIQVSDLDAGQYGKVTFTADGDEVRVRKLNGIQ